MEEKTNGLEAFHTGQPVVTGFGPGVIRAISFVDNLIYVALSNPRSGLYVLRPEQVEVPDSLQEPW